MTRPLLLAHRGACRLAPENSFTAFDAALDLGCDGFEFDLRLTADGQAVLCHDARVRGRVVARSTLAQLNAPSPLARLRRGNGSAPLATLPQVLERYAGRAFLDIELKAAGLEEVVIAALERWPPQHGFVVSSFLPQVVRELHRLQPGLPLGYVFRSKRAQALWPAMPGDWLMPHRRLATRALLEQAQEAGRRVCVWTVNNARQMQRLAEWGADAIISDNINAMRRLFLKPL